VDKDEQQHLKEYKTELAALRVRTSIMEGLIKDLEAKETVTVTAQHDFPNFAKYNKGTDI